jgi:hypothetical protein
MKLLAALLLVPLIAVAPREEPRLVRVAVGHERATGFVVSGDRVVTVAHVIDGPVVVDGRAARVVRVDRRSDLALLAVPGVRGEARLGGGGDTRVLGRSAPIVRRIRASVDGGPRRAALELRADVEAGASGAPVLTREGTVAGVVFARSRERARTAYAVDASAVAALLRRSRR